MTEKKRSKVVRINAAAKPPPPGEDEALSMEQYIHDRVADVLVLAGALYGTDSATAGNEIVLCVVSALEDAEVHVSKDLEPLRTLMEISEQADRESEPTGPPGPHSAGH
jgi:hypothetical protein